MYYTSSENFTYYCKFGNIHDEHNNNYHVIHNVNSELFEKLLSYASEKSYNPFTVFKEVNDLEEIPVNNSDTVAECKNPVYLSTLLISKVQ